MEPVQERLGRVLEKIELAARRSGRDPREITLVAVTKTISFERVLPFLQAGIRHVGENRVQEALAKYQSADGSKRADVSMHLIGQLQTNKAKKAVSFFDMVQSLDRLELADALDRHARDARRQLPCLVEVKLSAEETKAGLAPERLGEFLAQMRDRTALAVKGLMGIAPYGQSAEEARPFFRRLRKLWDEARLEILSMGMSRDFEIAIEEGATLVRIGTALFGARATG